MVGDHHWSGPSPSDRQPDARLLSPGCARVRTGRGRSRPPPTRTPVPTRTRSTTVAKKNLTALLETLSPALELEHGDKTYVVPPPTKEDGLKMRSEEHTSELQSRGHL